MEVAEGTTTYVSLEARWLYGRTESGEGLVIGWRRSGSGGDELSKSGMR